VSCTVLSLCEASIAVVVVHSVVYSNQHGDLWKLELYTTQEHNWHDFVCCIVVVMMCAAMWSQSVFEYVNMSTI
jgi:hypothetical protein